VNINAMGDTFVAFIMTQQIVTEISDAATEEEKLPS
jgi:hypothetical protein